MRSASARVALLCACGLLAAGAAAGAEGERWYVWSLRGKPSGYFHVSRGNSRVATAPIVLTHQFVVSYRGKRMSLTMKTLCKADGRFTPVRIESRGEGDDELGTYEAKIDWGANGEGVLKTELRGRKKELRLPKGTVTGFALFEVVAGLPFRKGVVFEFHSLEASELNLKRDHTIAYLGTETLDVRGKQATLHKFEQKGRGITPVHYWVDDQHRLVRVVMDERKEFLLGSKALAAEAIEQAK